MSGHYCLGFAFLKYRKQEQEQSYGEREVVLIQKARPDWQKGKLNGVGGGLHTGESDLCAMVREFWEETGIPTSHDQWHRCGTISGEKGITVSVFTCELPAHHVRWHLVCDNDEEETVYIISFETVLEMMPDGCIHNLPWLIMFCLDRLQHQAVFTVDYQSEAAAPEAVGMVPNMPHLFADGVRA